MDIILACYIQWPGHYLFNNASDEISDTDTIKPSGWKMHFQGSVDKYSERRFLNHSWVPVLQPSNDCY